MATSVQVSWFSPDTKHAWPVKAEQLLLKLKEFGENIHSAKIVLFVKWEIATPSKNRKDEGPLPASSRAQAQRQEISSHNQEDYPKKPHFL